MNQAIGFGILVLAIIGHTTWWVVLVNRRHSAALPEARLKRFRRIHEVAILLFPALIVWLAGFGETGLLVGGTFGQQSALVRATLLLALAGVLPFTYSALRWQLRRPPTVLVREQSRTVNVLSETGLGDVMGDRSSFLANLPGNEIHRLEVNEKAIDLSRRRVLPATAEQYSGNGPGSLRLAHFSDTHLTGCPGRGYFEYVADRLCEMRPDAFLFTGDLLDDPDLLPWGTEIFARLAEVAPGYFLLGNHDWRHNPERIRSEIVATGWTSLAGRSTLIRWNDVSVLLAGTEMPWLGSAPVVPSRSEESVRILLSHSPDERDFALRNNFDVLLAGHNHGGQVVLPVIGPVYSPSRYGVRYAGGLFQHGSMVTHVSRGIGGQHALRWNCPPEISLLRLSGFASSSPADGMRGDQEAVMASSAESR